MREAPEDLLGAQGVDRRGVRLQRGAQAHHADCEEERRQGLHQGRRIERPGEDGQIAPAQTRRAGAVDRGDEVEAREQSPGRRAGQTEREQGLHHAEGAAARHREVVPAALEAAQQGAGQQDRRAEQVQDETRDRGARIGRGAGADHARQHGVAQHRGDRRHEHQEDHDQAVGREEPAEVGRVEGLAGRAEIARMQHQGEDDAEDEGRQHDPQVLQPESSVIRIREPIGEHRVPPGTSGCVVYWPVPDSVCRKATRASTSRSPKRSAKTGMTGSKPSTTRACGSRTDWAT